jgi:hypothetical protein
MWKVEVVAYLNIMLQGVPEGANEDVAKRKT